MKRRQTSKPKNPIFLVIIFALFGRWVNFCNVYGLQTKHVDVCD